MADATYRVLSGGINCPGAPGIPQLRIERPVDKRGRFTDSDDKPTTVTAAAIAAHQEACGAFCHLKVDKLLRDGAIVPVPAPAPKRESAKGDG